MQFHKVCGDLKHLQNGFQEWNIVSSEQIYIEWNQSQFEINCYFLFHFWIDRVGCLFQCDTHSTRFCNTISLKLVVEIYGQRHSSVYSRHPRSSSWTFLSYYTLITQTLKSWQNAILLCDGTNFFPSSQNVEKSVSTQCC